MAEPLTILIAARDEEERIAETVEQLGRSFPEADLLVADDGSRDATARRAEEAGALVLRLPARGKGQALSAGERVAAPGRLLLCDADLTGNLRPLLDRDADLAIAVFAERQGGGFGVAKGAARRLVQARSGFSAREPLSGQRVLSPAARAACFPLAPGFGCEVRMTVEAVSGGLDIEEVELDLTHRPAGRDLRGFLHRGRQLKDILLALGPLSVNHRGLRLPLVGWVIALGGLGPRTRATVAVALIDIIGLADDVWSGPERGWRAHLRSGRTTGVLKLAGIPAVAAAATRSLSAGLLIGLAANAVNLLDTKPGRALKVFLAGSALLRGPTIPYAGVAVILLPYDLGEVVMLGDSGANALGAMLGFGSVAKFTERSRWLAIGALAGLNLLGELRSLDGLIERTPGLRALDRLGRAPS